MKHIIWSLTSENKSINGNVMQHQFEFGDINEAVKDWGIYCDEWIASLRRAKQAEPSKEQLASLREIFLEAYLIGRTSK